MRSRKKRNPGLKRQAGVVIFYQCRLMQKIRILFEPGMSTSAGCMWSHYPCLRVAISIEKRYFTSDFTSLS